MEATHIQEKQRGQRRNNPVVQQLEVEDVDFDKVDFYLSTLEEQVRCELKDSEARLTQSRSEGKLYLEIQEQSLTDFLDQLQDTKETNEKDNEDKWSCEREQMQSEIYRLRAVLDKAQARHIHSKQQPVENTKQLREIRFTLQKTQDDLKQQTSNCKDLEVKLQKMRREYADLQNEGEAMKLEVRVEKQLRAAAEHNIEATTQSFKVQLSDKEFDARSKAEQLEAYLVFERAQAQKLQMKLSEMEDTLLKQKEDTKRTVERAQASHRAQLKEQQAETKKTALALKKAEDLLKAERFRWQQENNTLVDALKKGKSSLLQATEDLQKSLQEKEHEAKKTVEQIQASYQAQLEEQRAETTMTAFVLKKAEDLLETERLRWQQENNALLDALKKVEQQLESHRIKWQEDKSSLLQATEDLKKTLQDKEHEARKTVEQTQASHQVQLEKQQAETRKIASVLKMTEDLLETEHIRWQQETVSLLIETEKFKAFYVTQLDKQKQENNVLVDALKTAQQQLEGHCVEWQEDKSTLVQATEGLMKTLQLKEQEWLEKESSMKSQLEALESQITKKKKKKKWYKRLIHN